MSNNASLEGNSLDLFAPKDSGSPPQEFLLTEAQPRLMNIFGEANLKVQIDSLLPEGPVIICFIRPIQLCIPSKKKMIILTGSLLDLPWF